MWKHVTSHVHVIVLWEFFNHPEHILSIVQAEFVIN